MSRHHLLSILMVVWLLASCQSEPDSTSEISPELSPIWLSAADFEDLRQQIQEKASPQYEAWQACERAAIAALKTVPSPPETWYVPLYYADTAASNAKMRPLRTDANAAYTLALAYAITEEAHYAEQAATILDAWATGIQNLSKKDNSTLSFSVNFPAMIFTADILRQHSTVWPAEKQALFTRFLQEKAMPMSSMSQHNNWGNWGMFLAAASGAYLQDTMVLGRVVARHKNFMDKQLDSLGHFVFEVTRDDGKRGLAYSHYALQATTLALQVLKLQGTDLFAYQSADGHNLEQAFRQLASWTRFPETFPYWKGPASEMINIQNIGYFEILNRHWPDSNANALLSELRPLSARELPWLTLTHAHNHSK